jgi:purine-cytosine permease-like protein
MIPAFMSTFGPALGLRQMTSARYSWGYYGGKIVGLLACIACVGWTIVNTISGTQTLVAVADWNLSPAAGTVIIAVLTLIVGFLGYRFVHRYESVSWIPTAISFLVLLGISAKHLVSQPMQVGRAEAASVLSFGGTVFGFAVGWSSLSSDYNVYMPASSKSWKVFLWTYTGLVFPLVLVMWLGAAIGSAAKANADWMAAYEEHELGGLLHAVFGRSLSSWIDA